MRTRGVKVLDAVLDTVQVDWLIVRTHECPDEEAEQHYVSAFFRIPHNPWGADRAFVHSVVVRRSHRRVFFSQESGLNL
jgi:hypothetical protein